MEYPLHTFDEFAEELNFLDLVDTDDVLGGRARNALADASQGAVTEDSGQLIRELQEAMDDYSKALNEAAIAKSTGRPVRTDPKQFKGKMSEVRHRETLIIDARAKGIRKSELGAYTQGPLPDGTVLSETDMRTDISVWVRKRPWRKPELAYEAQLKMYTSPSSYSKASKNPQYEGIDIVGASDMVARDTVSLDVRGVGVSSEGSTNEAAEALARDSIAQNAPEYGHHQERMDEQAGVIMSNAVLAGAAVGFARELTSAIREIIELIRNGERLTEDQFVERVKRVFLGTVEGGAASGLAVGSVQLLGKMLGKEIAYNTVGAAPALVLSDVAVDFGKDLYACFCARSMSPDDLLGNTLERAFTSSASVGGSLLGGRMVGSALSAAKGSAAIGASIGSALGPIGSVVGATLGSLIIGAAADAILQDSRARGVAAYLGCVMEINDAIDRHGAERIYYFVDSMSELGQYKPSFADLLRCNNFFSDLTEYRMRVKALQGIKSKLSEDSSLLEAERRDALLAIRREHELRMAELRNDFRERGLEAREMHKRALEAELASSYTQYLESYETVICDVETMVSDLRRRNVAQAALIDCTRHRLEANALLIDALAEILADPESGALVRPFQEQLSRHLEHNDPLLVGRQYISTDESIALVGGVL